MSNTLELTPQARDDARQAFAWYELQRGGLGERFLSQVEECFERIRANPELFERVYKDYRRAIVRRFPYVVFYRQEVDQITVHSVFNTSQNPRKLRRRLS